MNMEGTRKTEETETCMTKRNLGERKKEGRDLFGSEVFGFCFVLD